MTIEERLARLEAIVLKCSCQYGPGMTPVWYRSVRTCPLHSQHYNPGTAPDWAKAEPHVYGLQP
jgi:hypothetical protein